MECAHIPWHFTTALDLLDHWQALAAGLVAIVGAVIAVVSQNAWPVDGPRWR